MTAKEIGREIAKYRIKAGLTQKELGEKLGLKDVRAISGYENGYKSISAKKMIEIFAALGVEAEVKAETIYTLKIK